MISRSKNKNLVFKINKLLLLNNLTIFNILYNKEMRQFINLLWIISLLQ